MKIIFLLVIIGFIVSQTYAQKLPKIQEASVWAPVDIKIDGDAKEWNYKFLSYNPATELYYTIANDSENLYLTVQVTDEDVINKIVDGGLSFIVPVSGKKDNKRTFSFTFPSYDTPNHKMRIHFNLLYPGNFGKSAETQMDENNQVLTTNCKLIRTENIKGLDTLLSVYNTDGVKAICKFDVNKVFCLEMAIPLKYLGMAATGIDKLAYHILLNGANPMGEITAVKGVFEGHEATEADLEAIRALVRTHDAPVSSPTDFWGEYTLAKKP